MRKQKNKHGLSRTIPEDIKRQIRQNSGFGCVICGLGICEYEHVDPEFEDAKIHDPTKMVLLCGQHHSKVTRGILSKETVKTAMAKPASLQNGFANESFDISRDAPLKVIIGNNTYENVNALIVIDEAPMLEIRSPDFQGAPFLLSAKFFNSNHQISLQIIDNEWKVSSGNWDVTTEGKVLTIREAKRKIHLQIIANPPHSLTISRIDMFFKGFRVVGDDKKLKITYPGGKESLVTGGNSFSNTPVGIHIHK